MNESTFGPALRKAREAKGLSQAALARELNVTPGVIVRWERDERLPSLKVRPKLFQLLPDLPAPPLPNNQPKAKPAA